MWGKLFGDLIITGVYAYTFVVDRRPDLKEDVDSYLTSRGQGNLIV